jgi:hypothetical protein
MGTIGRVPKSGTNGMLIIQLQKVCHDETYQRASPMPYARETMMSYKTAVFIFFAFGFNYPAFAQFYKCTLEDGSVVFSDKRCATDAERYEIKEAYKPDPSNLNIPQRQINNQYERAQSPKSSYGNNRQIATDVPPALQDETAHKCTTTSGKTYYSPTGCGSSNAPIMTPQGPAMTLGKPFHDRQETSSKAEACAWAKAKSLDGSLSSQERRSARSMMPSVCN